MSVGSRLKAALTSPWAIGFSVAGASYGFYVAWDATQSGAKYDLEADLTGKTYIVTGATSGIGKVTTEELAKRGARVIMACRNREKCIQIRRDIVLETRNKQIYCRQCDLEDFESIRNFVAKLCQGKFELDRIDGLLNNAGIIQSKREINKEGLERTLATNHLGSFLLTGLLLDKLLAQNHPVRIVFMNSNVIDRKCEVPFDDLNSENRKKFDGFGVYKETKLENAMFAKELSERLKGTNITVNVADPGRTKSNLSYQMDRDTFFLSRWMLRFVSFLMGERKVGKAVRPVMYALCDAEMEGKNGIFVNRERNEQPWNANVMDADKRNRIWATSEVWSKLPAHMAQLRRELGESVEHFDGAPSAQKALGSKRWWTLWLW